MEDNITLTKRAFVELLEIAALGGRSSNPNPDDPGPVGPAGPVIRRGERVFLNPQPLPPRWALAAVAAWGPQPDPWMSAGLAAAEVSRVVDHVDAAVMAGADEGETGARGGARLRSLVEDWCATPRRRWPGPRPKPFPGEEQALEPVNLIFAGAQLHRAAEALEDHALRGALAEGAERLFQTGLEQMAEQV